MAKNLPLKKQTLRVENLSLDFKREMFSLFEKYYDHVNFERFLEDLNEKTHIFTFTEENTKRLVGFSTIYRKSLPHIASGTFLFSGDTVIHEDYWGNKMLQKSFFWFILESKLISPTKPVYWMLISKGVKTYLMMRKNFEMSFPNYKGVTPPHYQNVLSKFYEMKYPGDFNASSGLIKFDDKLGAVKAVGGIPTPESLKDKEAKFFFDTNPLYHEGDELACVCEIRFTDFFFHLFKFFIPIKKK